MKDSDSLDEPAIKSTIHEAAINSPIHEHGKIVVLLVL